MYAILVTIVITTQPFTAVVFFAESAGCWQILWSSSNPHQAIPDALAVLFLTRPTSKSYFSNFSMKDGRTRDDS